MKFLLRSLIYPKSYFLNIEIAIFESQRDHTFRKSTTSSTMVFTDTQITAFFTEATQMGISVLTRQTLEDEDISTVTNLHEWEDGE